MYATYLNAMIMPLVVYRYWVGVFSAPHIKAADAATDDVRAEVTDLKPMIRTGRRLRYVSTRIQRARQKAHISKNDSLI
jgi:hypothetical protein